jgi:ribonuclease HII
MAWAAWRRMRLAEARLKGAVTLVAGVDEAGRGPLAGPVVAAAVVLDPGKNWDGLDDSKQLDPETRSELFVRVSTEARAFAWAVVGQRAIERMNIRRASLTAMARSVALLKLAPELVLVDGIDTIPGVACPQMAVVDGDARMLSIAAASVLAKVVRDRIMERLDRVWPGYGFAQHKGYATPEHLDAIRRLGPCRLHRFTFGTVALQELPFDAVPAPMLDTPDALEALASLAIAEPCAADAPADEGVALAASGARESS